MEKVSYISLRVILTLFLALVISSSFYAQKQTKIDSIKLQNGLKGHSMFEFESKLGEEMFNGSFEFYQSDLDPTNEAFAIGITYNGNYSNNEKHGDWIYSYSRLKPSILKRLDKTNIIYAGTGWRFGVYGNFKQDEAVGKWRSILEEVEFGKPVDTLFAAISEFNKSQMVNSFEGWCDSIKIEGKIDDEGFLTGEWVFYQNTKKYGIVEERRMYESGVLVGHVIVYENKEHPVKHIGLDQTEGGDGEDWKEVSVSRDYFNIIYQTNFGVENELSIEKTNSLIKNSNEFLKKSLFSFGNHNNRLIWDIRGDAGIIYPKLRVRAFPYSNEDKENIEKGLEHIKNSSQIIDDFLSDSQVDITRFNYKEVSLYYEIYKLYNEELQKLKRVFEKLNLPAYQYINRDEILPHLLKDGIRYPEEVAYEYGDKKAKETYQFPEGISSENKSIQVMVDHLEAILAGLVATKEEVAPILEKNRKQAQIADKEETLIQLRDSIKELFDNVNEDDMFNNYHERFGSILVDYTQNAFKTYAKKDIENRINEIDQIITCYKYFIEFYTELVQIEEKTTRLKEDYTRVVWNPFTFTEMEERVKERVFTVYESRLLPFVLNGIEESINCNDINSKVNNFNVLYERMKEIRQKDTKTLERELKRTNDLQKIIDLYGIVIK